MDILSILGSLESPSDMVTLKNFLIFFSGLLVHILKQMWMEQVTLRQYLLTYKGRTALSTTSLFGSFALLSTAYPEASLLLYFLGGYSVDSIMNKTPLTFKKLEKEKQNIL